MNRFGEIADELTDLIEELDEPTAAPEISALKSALERAFIRACEADRALLRIEKARPRAAAAPTLARPRRTPATDAPSAVIIQLPRPWLVSAAARRRLGD